ncbi:hypothetical protein ACFL6E_01125 [Candidatus Neomarinimicrobiota bacterium]
MYDSEWRDSAHIVDRDSMVWAMLAQGELRNSEAGVADLGRYISLLAPEYMVERPGIITRPIQADWPIDALKNPC